MINSSDVTLFQFLSLSQVVATSSNILYNNFMHDFHLMMLLIMSSHAPSTTHRL